MRKCFVCRRCARCCAATPGEVMPAAVRQAREMLAAGQGLIWTTADGMLDVLLFNDEVRRLRDYAARYEVDFNPVPLLWCFDMRSSRVVVLAWTYGAPVCPFLDGGGCLANPVKPLVCRAFPVIKTPGAPGYMVSGRCPVAGAVGGAVDVGAWYPGEVEALRVADARMTGLLGLYELLRNAGVVRPRLASRVDDVQACPSEGVVDIESLGGYPACRPHAGDTKR
ncbi:MAG: hypothetical protein R6U10_03455 [Thermoplasmatota archaeon]